MQFQARFSKTSGVQHLIRPITNRSLLTESQPMISSVSRTYLHTFHEHHTTVATYFYDSSRRTHHGRGDRIDKRVLRSKWTKKLASCTSQRGIVV
eukprot:scaffold1064_cov106-Alexandrium_tamarense.AAC.2